MSLIEVCTGLNCASSNDHIVEEPFILACSHGICKNCIPKDAQAVTCKICGTNQNITKKESTIMKNLINISLPGLFDGLERRMGEQIRKYKGIFERLHHFNPSVFFF